MSLEFNLRVEVKLLLPHRITKVTVFIAFLKYLDKLGQIKQDTQVVVLSCQNTLSNLQGLFHKSFVLNLKSACFGNNSN